MERGTILLEPELMTPTDIDDSGTPEDAPPIYGRCPVCGKPLFPRCKRTGAPKAPVPGTGYDSRAKCGGCGALLTYIGSGQWRVLTNDDLSDDDRFADSLGMD